MCWPSSPRPEVEEWRVKQDEEKLKAAAQFELDTLAESARVARTGLARAMPPPPPKTPSPSARKSGRCTVASELGLMPEPVRGRPVIEEESEIGLLPNLRHPARPPMSPTSGCSKSTSAESKTNEGG
jgi:hypothetical protein